MNSAKRSKMFIGSALALSLVFTAVLPVLEAQAAEPSLLRDDVEVRYIQGDGVKFRREGHINGEVLGLMYDGEKINYYPYILGSDPEYNYMYRISQGLYGYVDHHYTRFNP